MKILVTGGAGYIGSHTIIEILENTDWEIISVDNFSNSSPETFDRIEKITNKRIVNYCVDINDIEKLDGEVFSNHLDLEGVIHFAAFKSVGESVEKPLKYYNNNIGTLTNILSCQEKYAIPYHIFSSSCSVYGNVQSPILESTAFSQATSPYAYTKQVCEQIIKDHVKATKCAAIPLRYFNPIGSHITGMNGQLDKNPPDNLLPYISQTAMGKREILTIHGNDYSTLDGTCIRDYINVSDVANAHLLAMSYLKKINKTSFCDAFNIGLGSGYSVLEILKCFEEVNRVKVNYRIGPRRAGDLEKIYANSNKAKEIFGWKAKYKLEESLVSSWKWENYLIENNNDILAK